MKKSILLGIVFLVCYSFGYSQCLSNITITGAYSTTLTQSADWIISDTSSPTTILGTNITLEAGDYIQLNPDFIADATSTVFTAQIVPCTLGINESSKANLFTTFPNPTSGIVTIKSDSAIKSYTLFDLNGRILRSEATNANEQTVDLSNLSSGIYLLEVATEHGSSIEKIVKK